MKKYIPKEIEGKWQQKWREDKIFSPDLKSTKRPYYALMMFPYPSGEGLHVGNMLPFTAVDIVARFKRMQGFDVFEPIGLDSFGIHTENYALQVNKHPQIVTEERSERFYSQLMSIGDCYDWTKLVETHRPQYYKWTQWIFLQLFKAGLAVRKEANVNWCPSCKTVLADEQVISGECERCSSKVQQKLLKQWFFKITNYAEKLLTNLEKIDWTDKVKNIQRSWIGRSEGVLIKFDDLGVFTTRSDTIFGATFVVVSPDYSLLDKYIASSQKGQVQEYIMQTKQKSELERKESKEKSGVFTGKFVTNPLTKTKIPVWVADYVLISYGTGAIMAVPAHDTRDFEFAQKYGLEIKQVIKKSHPRGVTRGVTKAYEGEGIMVNSGEYDGMQSWEAREKISEYIEGNQIGNIQIQYHLRDWLISRQRYWGPPIPIIYCDHCGVVPVPEKDLPVELPYIEDFKPKGKGTSPLAEIDSFVNTTCPKCQGPAKRETDVSDNFLDSAWYFFRYPSAGNEKLAFDRQLIEKWLPVNIYIGGFEHATLHLMYTRFITMVLKDLQLISFDEPFKKFIGNGHILSGGMKMSKSKGNVINPDEYIKEFGADTLRLSLMFLAPLTEGGDFKKEVAYGMYKFLQRIWDIICNLPEKEGGFREKVILNKTIKKVSDDIETAVHFNTAISSIMILLNFISRQGSADKETKKTLLKLLAPFAPHITEELWSILGGKYSIHKQSWPRFDNKLLVEDEVEVVIQVNGKVRDTVLIQKDIVGSKEKVENLAKDSQKVQKFLQQKSVKKVIYVQGKIINFVV